MPRPRRLHGVRLSSTPEEKGFGDGDWARNPWFLRPEFDEEFSRLGWGPSARVQAKKGLDELFPPEVCRDLDAPWLGGLVLPLFEEYRRFPHSIVPLLAVGRDAYEVEAWKANDLLGKLRQRDSFDAAAFELRAWANLKRHGYTFDKVPETPRAKTPDFRLRLRGEWYALDCKALDASDADDVAEEWRWIEFDRSNCFFIDGWNCIIEAVGDYQGLVQTADGRDRLRGEKNSVVAALREAANRAKNRGVFPCVEEAPPYGRLRYEPVVGGLAACENRFLGEMTGELEAQRARRLVRKGLGQLAAENLPVIIMLDVGFRLPPRTVVDCLLADSRAHQYEGCAMVIVVGYGTTKRGDRMATPSVLSLHPDTRAWSLTFAGQVAECVWRNPFPGPE